MRIRGLGVIDDAVLEFSPGFTVLTGETGAGKTMVLQGLGLLLGRRADAGRVRPGAQRAFVEGRISLDAAGPVAERAREAGAQLEDGELLVSRSVTADGRSRAAAGGAGAPAALLAELTGALVAVHGQSDQHRLLRPEQQRELLDRYGGPELAAAAARYRETYARWRAVTAEIDELTAQARRRRQEADLLRLQLAEIEAADPQPGEDGQLAAEASRLQHAETLREAADRARELLLGGPADAADTAGAGSSDAVGLVARARQALESEAAHDPRLAELAARVAEAGYLLSDAAADIASYAADVDIDPARLAAVHERRAVLTALLRKYGEDVDQVLAHAGAAAERLHSLDGDEVRIDSLSEEQHVLRRVLGEAAGALSGLRRESSRRLAAAVTAELTELAMPSACVVVEVRPLPIPAGATHPAFAAHGADEVEFTLAPHPGAPLRPLDRGASGGELSRIMLALEVALAGQAPVPTFVFDEVDAGIGGRAAVEVGRRLARLAEQAQVVVVTHLPQVAAFADQHLLVEKSDDGSITSSGVSTLDEAGRLTELSRMLAGVEESAHARRHARELLVAARADRRRSPEPRRRGSRSRSDGLAN
ncbi:MAG: DNA repair protein RecN [Actinomycetota bacterium]|nr:DNA repair protein RecN [Actinomycetota bacterium]